MTDLNRSSTWLAIAMIVLALAQIVVAIIIRR